MKQPKLTRSQFDAQMKAQAELLIREGRMPPLEEVLRAIEESRQKYRKFLDRQGRDRST